MFSKTEVAKSMSLGSAGIKIPTFLVIGPLLSFFGVPIFGLLLFILLVDFLTGIWKAKVSKTLNSNKFGDLLNRTVIYIILFSVIHPLVALAPLSAPIYKDAIHLTLSSTEYGLFFGYCMKELLSVFENLKAIQVFKGMKENFIIEMAMEKFGIDLEKALGGVAPSMKTQPIDLEPEKALEPVKEETK